MPLYERFVDGVKVGRAFTVDGSEDDARHAVLAATGADGWRAVNVDGGGGGDHGPAPSTPKRRTTKPKEA